jgi:hypothetical protein
LEQRQGPSVRREGRLWPEECLASRPLVAVGMRAAWECGAALPRAVAERALRARVSPAPRLQGDFPHLGSGLGRLEGRRARRNLLRHPLRTLPLPLPALGPQAAAAAAAYLGARRNRGEWRAAACRRLRLPRHIFPVLALNV